MLMAATLPSIPLLWNFTGQDPRLTSPVCGVSSDGLTLRTKAASRLALLLLQVQFWRSHSLTKGSEPAAGQLVPLAASGMQDAAGHWISRNLPAVAWIFSTGPAEGSVP